MDAEVYAPCPAFTVAISQLVAVSRWSRSDHGWKKSYIFYYGFN